MNNIKILALAISSALLTGNVNAATKVADARGNAMGNTGVASADYLTAPFYNPALTSSFKSNDDFGFLIAVGVGANDPDDTLTNIDDLQSFMDGYNETTASASDVAILEGYLDQLDGNQLSVNVGLGLALALPTNVVATNLFARGYTEVVSTTLIEDSGNAYDNYIDSEVELLAFG